MRSHFLKCAVLAASTLLVMPATGLAAGTLRIGMTVSDIPLTTGQTDQGSEGYRFVGHNLYDGLTNWDMSSADKPPMIEPGLAVSWSVNESDKTKWTFKLRDGVKFHDGSAFNAAAVVWNLDKILNDKSEQYDPRQAGLGVNVIPAVKAYRVIDDLTVEITTKTVDATLPYQLTWLMISSPSNWEAQGRDWIKVAAKPSGTGPWKLDRLVPRERAELVPNSDYWDDKRVPKLDRMVLLPLPEPNARSAALMSGQVDWIEAPAYDMVPALEGSGFKIVSNSLPHNWTWQFSRLEGSPWNDENVRKAANLAVDREGLKQLLGGLMIPAKGFLPPSSQWFGKPTFDVRYDVEEAKALMAKAGYGPDKRLKVKTVISSSGSGQMLPMPMNEFIQQNLAQIGIDAEFEVVDFNTLIDILRAGVKSDVAKGANAINYTYSLQDPYTAAIRYLSCDLVPPKGVNWGYYCDKEMDGLLTKIKETFDPEAQNEAIQRAHEKYVNDADFLMVAHDVAPRAMSAKVKGFVQAQNWFQNFSSITIEE